MNESPKPGSCGEILHREVEVLYRVARRLTGNMQDAEDLVGQAMLVAFKNWDKFDGRHPRSWLIKVLQNEWLQVLRKRKVRQESNLADGQEPSDEGFWKNIDSQLEHEQIVEAIDRIPPEYRVVVTLCDIEELSYEEAAEALNIPIGTIRSRLFRGRKLLRSRLVQFGNQTP